MSVCYVNLDGEKISRAEYCRRLGYNYNAIRCMMRVHGISFEQAILEWLKPVHERSWAKKISKDRRLYQIWNGMMGRCYNTKHPSFRRYGGRGIKVQESWHDYFNFEDDMYEEYIKHCEEYGEKDTTIDRFPNNDGNYEINNVRWATREEQANNTSRNIKIAENLTPALISKIHDVAYGTILNRHKRGWTDEELLNSPIQEHISFNDVYAPTGESVRELAKRLNMREETIMGRIRRGWDWNKILETPLLTNTPITAPTGETFKQLSERLGIPVKTIHCRYDRGWTWQEIMETPLGQRRKKK